MSRVRMVTQVSMILLIPLVSSCTGVTAPEVTSVSEPALVESQRFAPGNFEDSTTIDNKWFPLKPGTQFVYEGETVEDGESVPHRIVVTVTDLTKVIDGVRAVVTWDRDYSAEELVEAELAFFAQDKDGTVWRMGEYPEEYENGEFTMAPAWIHGLEDARAGVAMYANPQVGSPSYAQGWGPAVGWTDRGQVDQMGQELCIPVDCYQEVLVISETSEAEPGAFQLKYYAPGVGNVKTDWRGADKTQETLEMIELVMLSPEKLAEVRAQAIDLEKHAYEVSSMYARTSPAEFPTGAPVIAVTAVRAPQAGTPIGAIDDEVVVYAMDLPASALYEMDFIEDPDSPGGKRIGLPNNGDELDPPPENDPHVTFPALVKSGLPYRCWIHMKVGAPKGKSLANVFWVQFSDAVDKSSQQVFKPGSNSYLTAQGPEKEGWTWVGCDQGEAGSFVYFASDGEISVRLQAGMEGVSFDQFLLSSANFLEEPPSEAIVEK